MDWTHPCTIHQGPKHEIIGSGFLKQSKAVRVGDLGTVICLFTSWLGPDIRLCVHIFSVCTEYTNKCCWIRRWQRLQRFSPIKGRISDPKKKYCFVCLFLSHLCNDVRTSNRQNNRQENSVGQTGTSYIGEGAKNARLTLRQVRPTTCQLWHTSITI